MDASKSSTKTDLWVFRDGHARVESECLVRELAKAAEDYLEGGHRPSEVIPALLRAGELESALADRNSPGAWIVEQITDVLASAFCSDASGLQRLGSLLRDLQKVSVPSWLEVSPAEGFAFYALHPSDFAQMVDHQRSDRPTAVIGIRSIGTTLSAIVAATIRQAGKAAERITVRPTGHPYGRATAFSEKQAEWIKQPRTRDSEFLVVDEGPGRSGSSFLSVGEELIRQGIAAERITFVGSREVDPWQLCADNAGQRWKKFRFAAPRAHMYERFKGDIYIGGGEWRRQLANDGQIACWPQMERLKFLSRDRKFLFKFEGFGRFGEEVLARARSLAEAGFSPAAEPAGDGMLRVPLLSGRQLRPTDLSRDVLERIAEYCAFRLHAFAVSKRSESQMVEMLQFNVGQEFGVELEPLEELMSGTPLLVDGRMQAHEWIGGELLLKVDACTHGDDHFFPGPTDIAWDLAGAIVEWNMDRAASEALLTRFHSLTGDDARWRINSFQLAYAVFRMAYCQMGLSTVAGTGEEDLLHREYSRYRAAAEKYLGKRHSRGTRLSAFPENDRAGNAPLRASAEPAA